MLFFRRRFQSDLLDALQRHHLARDFGKAFGASLNLAEAALVKADDIAGIVPARLHLPFAVVGDGRFQHAGVFDAQIALHDVGPAQLQPPALFNAFNRHQARIHARQNATDGVRFRRHRYVDRHHRRAFGHAVAFKNADAILLHIDLTRRFLQLLRPRHDVTQTGEIVRRGKARIVAEEGRGPEQHGAVAVIDQLRHDAIVQRAGIEKHLRAGHQRREQTNRQAKGVEQRQRRHKFIARGKIRHGADLLHIRQQAFMGMHHPFRIALRAGGKQHHRRLLRLLRHLRAAREQQMRQDPEFILRRHAVAQILRRSIRYRSAPAADARGCPSQETDAR